MVQRFPALNLEDKVRLQEDENVINPPHTMDGPRCITQSVHPLKYLDKYMVPNAKKAQGLQDSLEVLEQLEGASKSHKMPV